MVNAAPIALTPDLLTGVSEIDTQHRVLINTLNEAATKLAADESGELFESITHDLLAYAIYHFETEERLMKRYGYAEASPADAAAHLLEHRQFSEHVVELRNNLRRGRRPSADSLIAFLNGWLINHIKATDLRLGSHIVGQREQDPS